MSYLDENVIKQSVIYLNVDFKERSEAIELEKLWVMMVIKAVDVGEATSYWENAAIDKKKMG